MKKCLLLTQSGHYVALHCAALTGHFSLKGGLP